MGYAEIAALAGVTLGPNGESPADFFYVQVRNTVANALHANEAEVLKTQRRQRLETLMESETQTATVLKGAVVISPVDGEIMGENDLLVRV